MAGSFLSPLGELAEYEDIKEDLCRSKGPVCVSGGTDSQKAHQIAGLASGYPLALVVAADEARAGALFDDINNFCDNAVLYPAKDMLFWSANVQGGQVTRRRMRVIKKVLEEKRGVVVTTVDGLMDCLMPADALMDCLLFVEEGQALDMGEAAARLAAMGYERQTQVEGEGQFAVRGGILDVFPLTEENPVRIELWGDEVDTIRAFDTETQRSIQRLQSIWIYPSREVVIAERLLEQGLDSIAAQAKKAEDGFRARKQTEQAVRVKSVGRELAAELSDGGFAGMADTCIKFFYPEASSFLGYFPEDMPVFIDEPQLVRERARTVYGEFSAGMEDRLAAGKILPGQADIMYSDEVTMERLMRGRTVLFMALGSKDFRTPRRYSVTARSTTSYKGNISLMASDLERFKREGWRVVLYCASGARGERLAADLNDQYGLRAFYTEDRDKTVLPGQICVVRGSLHKGFEYPLIRFAMICEDDLFGTSAKKKRRRAGRRDGQALSLSQIAVGDYVVHENHGIGIYRGLEKLTVDGVEKDYIKIEYAKNGCLFVPVTQLDLISKYTGGASPKVNTLGGQEWSRTKSRAAGAVKEMAADLLRLYADRQVSTGFKYSPDTVWQREFEELFPYELTDDQEKAIQACKSDMESGKVMDRLICGDVGYGKTEIALRAAFKAVQDGKQVAYLVPTTILAQQHYNTFRQRMMGFPVQVELLSRFRSSKEQEKTISDLKKGLVDIVIGTHRLLSDDVAYKDLGLLIIDEEQRFGVAHKEKIKKLKKNVDVMALTATPIPRTLHMSLIGIRDMSVLEEPPMNRMPIQTYVMEYAQEYVKEAIDRELARGGQVYYVHNRVHDIADVCANVQALVPDAYVAYAHGQMNERELERIMLDFVNGEIDVLVSTSIIETGLDISNVNTIIVQDADRFGLAQLYQLRGRVGRSARTAYAFLMYRASKVLGDDAAKRLQAIREYTELGSGVRIAMRDLEIRGAGDLLGAKQHGHMEAVGYDLYCRLLNDAVRSLKGETAAPVTQTSVDLAVDAYIPSSYIMNEEQKLELYKRIAAIESADERRDMQDELTDRFGEIPKPVENLMLVSHMRHMAEKVYVKEITGGLREIKLLMDPSAPARTELIPELVNKYKGRLRFLASPSPRFVFGGTQKGTKDAAGMLEELMELLADMEMLFAAQI